MIYNKFNFDDGSNHVNEPFYGGAECLVPTLIEPRLFRDERGYFFESFNMREFTEKMGNTINFVQDNESFSQKGTLRGMHYQKDGYAQAKLVRVIHGAVYDVAVDIRPWSSTFGKYVGVYLSGDNHQQFFIPRGFAHGFVALEDNTIFQYKCDNYYNKENEGSFKWDSIGIPWGNYINLNNVLLSEKDDKAPRFMDVFEDKLRAMSMMKKIGFNI
jgi:dTDP-4-dehydrorhamnose 3,5-epimerase